jgi:RimJ/RimL family protein N-acetyltransferase
VFGSTPVEEVTTGEIERWIAGVEGWMIVPERQVRGIAVAATGLAIELARREGRHRFMHAFPNVANAPSNAICGKLGFELLAACEFEFPKGHLMTCNDWRLELRAFRRDPAASR